MASEWLPHYFFSLRLIADPFVIAPFLVLNLDYLLPKLMSRHRHQLIENWGHLLLDMVVMLTLVGELVPTPVWGRAEEAQVDPPDLGGILKMSSALRYVFFVEYPQLLTDMVLQCGEKGHYANHCTRKMVPGNRGGLDRHSRRYGDE